jgi:hypothetical protein
MHEMDNRYLTRFCGVDVDFIVSNPKPKSKKPSFEVSVGMRGIETEFIGSDVQIDLVDERWRSLKKSDALFEYGVLPFVRWGNQIDSFKFEKFTQGSNPPKYLVLTILGEQEVFDISAEGKKTRAKEQDGSDEQGDWPEEGKDDGKKRRAPPAPTCCPNQFTTPNGNQPTTVRRFRNAAGAVNRVVVHSRPWVVQATFNNAPAPCNCTQCEYRQEVKGFMRVLVPGMAPQDVSPITDYQRPAGPGVAPGLQPVQGLNRQNFIEDAKGDRNNPGNPHRYGRRNDLNGRPGLLPFQQDYPTACSYWASDKPEVGGPPGGGAVTVDVDIDFRATIVDKTTNAIRSGPNTWKWQTRQRI